MKNSTEQDDYDVADEILARLLESKLSDQIVRRIEAAAAEYRHPEQDVQDASKFNDEIARFVQHLYRQALVPSRNLSVTEALAEAIDLLEYCRDVGGYESALLEAIAVDGAGVRFVLRCLAQALADRESSRMEIASLAEAINPTDWRLHHSLTEAVLRTYPEMRPSDVPGCESIHLAAHYKDLIRSAKRQHSLLSQFVTGPAKVSG